VRRALAEPVTTKHWREGEFVIGGWSPPRKDDGWGLLVGQARRDGRTLVPRACRVRVRAGSREDLERVLFPLERSATCVPDVRTHHDDVYIELSLTAEIRYLEQTSAGLLRHATFRQLGGRWT
jgi:ATP-dependent DNA ligase